MSQKKNDKTYTAADIEKYHKGLLPAKEMNALEKAALDDPMLADALEGYAVKNVNRPADMAELENRLAGRIRGENKMIPVAAHEHSSFSWWKAAAMIILVAGAGLIVYQFAFNKKKSGIAETAHKESPKAAESKADTTTSAPAAGMDSNTGSLTDQQEKVKPGKNKTGPSASSGQKDGQAKEKPTASDKNEPVAQTVTSVDVPPAPVIEKGKDVAVSDIANQKAAAEKQSEQKADKRQEEIEIASSSARQKRAVAVPSQGAENPDRYQRNKASNSTHVFRGRVTDAQNNALPFSNITNTNDDIGTYADANGYFNLTSPDTVLNVRVSSIGFETNNVRLQNNIPSNRVLLQEDRSGLAEVVISNKKINSDRSKNNTMLLDEPEPVDGWVNYDLYLANNLKEPDSKGKPSASQGVVELSFDVNKAGEPVNITVKKSLCEACDKEAIRLLKEGPKWKKKGKRSKAKVTIGF